MLIVNIFFISPLSLILHPSHDAKSLISLLLASASLPLLCFASFVLTDGGGRPRAAGRPLSQHLIPDDKPRPRFSSGFPTDCFPQPGHLQSQIYPVKKLDSQNIHDLPITRKLISQGSKRCVCGCNTAATTACTNQCYIYWQIWQIFFYFPPQLFFSFKCMIFY